MGWSDIGPGATYSEPALRRAVVELVGALDLTDVTLAGARLVVRGTHMRADQNIRRNVGGSPRGGGAFPVATMQA
jgi:hypothetical protein